MSLKGHLAEGEALEEIAQLIMESCHQESIPGHISVFKGQEFHVGRNDDNHMCLDNPLVSKHHFRIYSISFDNEGGESFANIYCEDLQSRNGTFVNDMLIGSSEVPQYGFLLSDGDIVSIKPYWTFRFYQPQNKSSETFSIDQRKEQEQFENEFSVSDRLLGTGATASVHLANHTLTGKQLACKVVKVQFAERRRINTEIDILSKLDHPNIVGLKKVFISPCRVYLFQELAAGGDLFSYAESKDFCIDSIDTRLITRQIVQAVKFLHSKCIAHRDLKIENILVTHNNDVGHRILITDFGHAFDWASVKQRMNSYVGTRTYMAPEILGGDGKDYTPAVDMWSIGIIVLILLTGECVIGQEASKAPAEYVLGVINNAVYDDSSAARRSWFEMVDEARNFIQQLLVRDAKDRLNASQAADHPWVAPKPLLEEFSDLDRRSHSYWTPKPMESSIKQYIAESPLLPELRSIRLTNSSKPLRKRHREVDHTAAVRFGLDQHLNPRKHSNREETLKKAQSSKNRFIKPQNSLELCQAVNTQESDILSVDGSNMFNNTPIEVIAARQVALNFENAVDVQSTFDTFEPMSGQEDTDHQERESISNPGTSPSEQMISSLKYGDEDQSYYFA